MLFNCANTPVNDYHHFCDNLKVKRSSSVKDPDNRCANTSNDDYLYDNLKGKRSLSTSIKNLDNRKNYEKKISYDKKNNNELVNRFIECNNNPKIKEKFNEILRSESEEVKYNRIGEYNSYDKILQLFDHRRRSNNFDEKYLYIFSDLDNLDDLFSSNVFKNLLNDEENLFRFIVYFKSLIWKHIVFEFEECISNKTIREIDHIYSIIVKVDNFIDKISKHLQEKKMKTWYITSL